MTTTLHIVLFLLSLICQNSFGQSNNECSSWTKGIRIITNLNEKGIFGKKLKKIILIEKVL
ncbi:MAG: hypothetical protein ACJA0U_002081 [Salibacteraceae bacterium]|jgi:hypothetical protein